MHWKIVSKFLIKFCFIDIDSISKNEDIKEGGKKENLADEKKVEIMIQMILNVMKNKKNLETKEKKKKRPKKMKVKIIMILNYIMLIIHIIKKILKRVKEIIYQLKTLLKNYIK